MDEEQAASEGVMRFVARLPFNRRDRPAFLLRLVTDGPNFERETAWRPAARRWEHSHFVLDDQMGHCDDNLVDITREQALELQEAWRIHLGQAGPPDRT